MDSWTQFMLIIECILNSKIKEFLKLTKIHLDVTRNTE